jgi:uncharacterized protein YjiS (DUF1127 family)
MEHSMSTLEQRLAARLRRQPYDSGFSRLRLLLAALQHLTAEWRRRAAGRETLRGLSDYDLRDIGVTRAEVERECTKPFWRA